MDILRSKRWQTNTLTLLIAWANPLTDKSHVTSCLTFILVKIDREIHQILLNILSVSAFEDEVINDYCYFYFLLRFPFEMNEYPNILNISLCHASSIGGCRILDLEIPVSNPDCDSLVRTYNVL